MEIRTILKEFGLSDKEIAVYLALIELGPSPVRNIATKANVNRGTTYDILKDLMKQSLVSYFDKQAHQYFTAEPPEKLVYSLEQKQNNLELVKKQIKDGLPALKTIFEQQGGRPTVRVFEGTSGIKSIMTDVLESVELLRDKKYYVYSASGLRKNVYEAMPDFTEKRIKKKIQVRTIALGEGGQLIGLDERKWLPEKNSELEATYVFIYRPKVAIISLDKQGNPIGLVIDNPQIFETQRLVFESLWKFL